MSGVGKGMIMYIMYPMNACSGPIDDLIVSLIGLAAQKGMNVIEDYEY